LDFTNDGCKIEIGSEEKMRVMSLLQNDIEFLQSYNMMSYSLLVGIHDPDMMDKVDKTPSDDDCAFSPGEDDDTVNGPPDDVVDSGGHDSEGANVTSDSEITAGLQSTIKQGDNCCLSPPDSPGFVPNSYPLFSGDLDPNMELFGIKSSKSANTIYFLGVVNIFTKYGMKKRTAQTYKSVRHGHNAEISSVRPELYAKRFLEFVNLAIE